MQGLTPEDVKRMAINFRDYCARYDALYDDHVAELNGQNTFEFKSNEELYKDFIDNKPVSL